MSTELSGRPSRVLCAAAAVGVAATFILGPTAGQIRASDGARPGSSHVVACDNGGLPIHDAQVRPPGGVGDANIR